MALGFIPLATTQGLNELVPSSSPSKWRLLPSSASGVSLITVEQSPLPSVSLNDGVDI